jgi:Tetracyclin repressor-like, C-terminal domain
VTIKAIEQHPAIIRLMDAPRSSNPAPDIKESLREQLVALFLTRKPLIFQNKAHRYAEIAVQMIRAMLCLYLENEHSERESARFRDEICASELPGAAPDIIRASAVKRLQDR